MAAFTDLVWQRLDVWAIVGGSGLAVIDVEQRLPCREWLKGKDYKIETLNLSGGANQIVSELNRLLNWNKQFGYKLGPNKPILNALRDGFRFEASDTDGTVLEIVGADFVWQEDPKWLLGLLSIAQEHSREHLALGRRFFTILVLPENSPLIGVPIEEARVPATFWSPYKQKHNF